MVMPRHTTRRPAGAFLIYEPDDKLTEYDTLQCVHCQKHWEVVVGSGIERGWCLNCAGPTCGKERCETKCIPAERMIEEIEGQRNLALALDRMREPS